MTSIAKKFRRVPFNEKPRKKPHAFVRAEADPDGPWLARGYMPPAARDDWTTPPKLFRILNVEFGFTVDAAASEENALCVKYWTEADDALAQDWAHERVFCNPPYGRKQVKFIQKAAEREAEVAVLLVPARTDTKVWHDYVFPFAEVRFIRGRVKFGDGKHPAPFPSALLIYRRGPGEGLYPGHQLGYDYR